MFILKYNFAELLFFKE